MSVRLQQISAHTNRDMFERETGVIMGWPQSLHVTVACLKAGRVHFGLKMPKVLLEYLQQKNVCKGHLSSGEALFYNYCEISRVNELIIQNMPFQRVLSQNKIFETLIISKQMNLHSKASQDKQPTFKRQAELIKNKTFDSKA